MSNRTQVAQEFWARVGLRQDAVEMRWGKEAAKKYYRRCSRLIVNWTRASFGLTNL